MLTLPRGGIDGADQRHEQDQRRRCSDAAKASPVATISPDAASSSLRWSSRAPSKPIASVISAEPSSASGGDDADLEGAEPERRQIDRQQHGDEAVAEIAQRPRRDRW